MSALWNRAGHYIFVLWFLLLSSFFLAYSQPTQIGCLPYFHHTWCGLSANLGCWSETCCMRLAVKYRTQKSPNIRLLPTTAQLCRAISWQLWHVSTIGKTLVKSQKLLHISSQYGELWPTSGWDLLASLGQPSKLQRVSPHGSVTARHFSSGRHPNFEALNRGRHLYLTGRPSRWALAHILVCIWFVCCSNILILTSILCVYTCLYLHVLLWTLRPVHTTRFHEPCSRVVNTIREHRCYFGHPSWK